jgi:hypothetical protein
MKPATASCRCSLLSFLFLVGANVESAATSARREFSRKISLATVRAVATDDAVLVAGRWRNTWTF